MTMPDLPTEADVAALNALAHKNGYLYHGDVDRLLALVEAWAPIVEEVADALDEDDWCPCCYHDMEHEPECSFGMARAEWQRWKGETT